MQVDVLRSLQHSAKTSCGYATINDVRDHKKSDRMESFFLAETTKYLYLLFDTDNFIHNNGQTGDVVRTQWGQCVVDAGGYVFNTEAHPIDPGALSCCRPVQSLFNSGKSVMGKFVPSPQDQKDEEVDVQVEDTQFEINKLADIKMMERGKGSIELITEEDIEDSIDSITDEDAGVLESSGVLGDPGDDLDDGSGDSRQAKGPDSRNSTKSQPPVEERKPFVPQALLEKIRRLNLYPRNATVANDYQVISCPAQPFLQRISIVGEFF